MSDQDVHSIPAVPEVGHEGGVSISTPHTVEINIQIARGDAEVSITRPILELVQTVTVGMGRVDLHSITLKYTFTTTNTKVYAVICDENNTHDIEQMIGFDGNFMATSNKFNVGVFHTIPLKVPGLFSRQLQPTSSQLPRFKIMTKLGMGSVAWLNIKLIHYGPIRRTLAFP